MRICSKLRLRVSTSPLLADLNFTFHIKYRTYYIDVHLTYILLHKMKKKIEGQTKNYNSTQIIPKPVED